MVLEEDGEISWTDRVGMEKYYLVLKRIEMSYLHKKKKKKANWISRIMRKNCLLKHVIEVKIEGML
jgi:hypothetical protein